MDTASTNTENFRFVMYMNIKEASEFLGVSPNTLRHWEKNDKIKVTRHPLNNYRQYDPQDLEELLEKITQE